MLKVNSEQFMKEDTTYDILLEIRKDTRNTTVEITVEIVKGIPPIMEIECADPLLCLVGEGGKLFINPTSRLAVRAQCSTKDNSDCSKMSYQWFIRKPGNFGFNIISIKYLIFPLLPRTKCKYCGSP